jgi:hypothetical protein
MPDHNIDVIDLGLTVPQAIEYELETENFTRRKELPADLELDDDALEWFTGTPIQAGWVKRHYECKRCELNAFSSDQLAEFIKAGLQRHAATTKLVPPADVLAAQVRSVRDEAFNDLVMRELLRMVNVDDVVHQLIAEHPDLVNVRESHVRAMLEDYPTMWWKSSVSGLVRGDIDAADDLPESIRAQIAEQLRASDNADTDDMDEP